MKRMHPINILENVSGYFWLLLFPLIRGFFSFRGGIWAWLGGVWFDLLILAAIFGLAFLRWWLAGYELTQDGVRIVNGILVRKDFLVPYRQFASVSLVAPFYYRPFGAVHLSADSDAGNNWKYDFTLTLPLKPAQEILRCAKCGWRPGFSGQRRTYRSSGFYIAMLAFISSKTVTGVLFTAAFLVQAGKILGHEFETTFLQGLTDLANKLAFGIPPAAVFLALVVVLGWVISFIINLARNYRFTVSRQENSLQIQCGFFTRYRHQMNVEKVNLVESRQSIITKAFHIHSLFLHCAGYGKAKNELSVLFPAASEKRVWEIVQNIMPEWHFTKRTVSPKGKSIFRFILTPVGIGVALGLAALVLAGIFPRLSDLILFLGGMFELPVLWWLTARIIAFYHTGISKSGGVYTFRFPRGFGFHSVAVREEKVVQVKLRQSIWQGMSGSCNLIVYTWSEGKKRHVIPALPVEQTCELMGISQPEKATLSGWKRLAHGLKEET